MNPKPRILVLTSRFPYPPIGGEKLRLYHIIRHLSKDFDIDLFTLYLNADELHELDGLRPYCRNVHAHQIKRLRKHLNTVGGWLRGLPLQVAYYTDRSGVRKAHALIREGAYDRILVHLVRMLEYVPGDALGKTVLEMTDAISMNYMRIGRPRNLRELLYVFERNRLLSYEIESVKKTAVSIVVTDEDAEYLRRRGAARPITVIKNGTDVKIQGDRLETPGRIVFLGNMRSTQNEAMCLHFIQNILPLVRQKFPAAHLVVVGANPSKRLLALHEGSSIIVTGRVKDPETWLRASMVSICPMLYGAGIQNKILESMALGVPVVSTSIGVEGTEARAGEEILIADTPEAFADAVVSLLRDPGLRERISQKALDFINERFRWEARMHDYQALMSTVKK